MSLTDFVAPNPLTRRYMRSITLTSYRRFIDDTCWSHTMTASRITAALALGLLMVVCFFATLSEAQPATTAAPSKAQPATTPTAPSTGTSTPVYRFYPPISQALCNMLCVNWCPHERCCLRIKRVCNCTAKNCKQYDDDDDDNGA